LVVLSGKPCGTKVKKSKPSPQPPPHESRGELWRGRGVSFISHTTHSLRRSE
jgi:hypothetical protein